MSIQRHKVQGQDIRLVVLPPFSRKASDAWRRFIASDPDGIYGLDVESNAIPAFEGKKPFNPAIYRQSYTVPHGLDQAVYNRGYTPGETRDMHVRTAQFGTATEGWVLDVNHPRWRKEIVSFLSNEGVRFVSHNAAFDATRVLHEFGIDLGERSIDTQPMLNLIWPGLTAPTHGRSKGLKEGCEYLLDEPGLLLAEDELHRRFMDLYHGQNAKHPKSFVPGESPCRKCREETSLEWSARGFCRGCYTAQVGRGGHIPTAVMEWGWDNIPLDDEIFTAYAGLDAVYVRRLLPVAAAEISRMRMNRLSRTEQRVKRLWTPRSVTGIKVDMDWTEDVFKEVGSEYAAAEAEVMSTTGLTPRQSVKLKDWLVKQGIPRPEVKSLDKDHLPGLVTRYGERLPVLESLAVCQRHSNLLTNLKTILRHAEGSDGRVHPNFNTLQAHTGRMSITGPAMQTLAKNGEKGERLRGCFVADDGYVLVGADYDNQEIRIAAALSRDPMLLRIVEENLSQHEETCKSIWPDFKGKKADAVRYNKGKILDFAQQYGAGPKAIAAQLGIPVTEARELWLAWRDTYAGLVAWSDEQSEKPYIRNPYGRVVPSDPFRPYANGNYVIQSTGRDMLGQAIVDLADAGWGSALWLPVHDELVLQVPEDVAETAAEALSEHMTTTLKGVPVTATGEVIGVRWRGL